MNSVILLPLLFVTICIHETISRECKPNGICSCKWDDTDKEISLEGINDQTSIKFKDINIINGTGSATDYQLDYNPCTEFTEGSGEDVCTDVIACQHNKAKSLHYKAGLPTKFSVNSDNDIVRFTYDGGFQDGYERFTEVTLVCKEDAYDPVLGTITDVVNESKTSSTYKFTLTTNCACESGCKASKKGGLSTGSALCIIFFVLLIVYFLGGFLFLKFYKNYEGVETIPQYEFWKDLPVKVKDGLMFTVSKVKGDNGGEYEAI